MKKIFFSIIILVLVFGIIYTVQERKTEVVTQVPPVTDGVAPTQPEQKDTSPTPTGRKLDLSNQQLTKIPDSVFGQTRLQELDVSHNQLTGAIQAEIRRLQNLRVLDASDNQMTGVPAEVGQLQNLEILDLSNNQLTGLPYELGNLKNLKTLNISGNSYSERDLTIIQQGLSPNVTIIK